MKGLNTLLSFQGRISRSTFWAVVLMNIIFLGILGVVADVMELKSDNEQAAVGLTYLVAAFWINLATQFKRWHDRDRSGWMILFNLVPFVGWLYCLFVLGFLKGTSGANQYGPDPLAAAESSPP